MTSPAEIRAQAARIVSLVSVQGTSLDVLLANTSGTPQERGLLRSLAYGTIRWQWRLEAALDRLSSRPQKELDPQIRALLLVGLFQLLHTDIALHAAVAESVEATRFLKQPRASGFVNAVLRRCLREKKELGAKLDEVVATRTAHPPWLVEMLARDWPERYLEILNANNEHPPMWLRINARRTTVANYLAKLEAAGYAATTSALAPDALLLSAPADVRALPGFGEGDVSVQDAAAQLAARLLDPQAGDRVLDACAAPGGKTCHLLELQPAIGELLAIDSSADRLERVHENLARLKLKAMVKVADAAKPEAWAEGRSFDRILLDVPCSATGVIRRHPDIKLLRRSSDIAELAERQGQMLRRVWTLLAPGGRLLYASCSALKAETSQVLAAFLADHPSAVEMTERARETAGIGIGSFSSDRERHGPGLAISAGEAQMDGFYYACIEKKG